MSSGYEFWTLPNLRYMLSKHTSTKGLSKDQLITLAYKLFPDKNGCVCNCNLYTQSQGISAKSPKAPKAPALPPKAPALPPKAPALPPKAPALPPKAPSPKTKNVIAQAPPLPKKVNNTGMKPYMMLGSVADELKEKLKPGGKLAKYVISSS